MELKIINWVCTTRSSVIEECLELSFPDPLSFFFFILSLCLGFFFWKLERKNNYSFKCHVLPLLSQTYIHVRGALIAYVIVTMYMSEDLGEEDNNIKIVPQLLLRCCDEWHPKNPLYTMYQKSLLRHFRCRSQSRSTVFRRLVRSLVSLHLIDVLPNANSPVSLGNLPEKISTEINMRGNCSIDSRIKHTKKSP